MKTYFPGIVICGILLMGGCRSPLLLMGSHATYSPNSESNPQTLLNGEDPFKPSPGQTANAKTDSGKSMWSQIFGTPATPRENPNLLSRARQAEEQNRPDDARRLYEQVLQSYPNDVIAHRRLAALADQRRDFRASEKHYKIALQHDPRNPDLLNDIGYSLLLQRRYVEGERAFNAALTIMPTHRRALENLARLYVETENYEGALAVFRQGRSEQEAREILARFFPNGKPAAESYAAKPGNSGRNPLEPLQAPLPRGHVPNGLTGQNHPNPNAVQNPSAAEPNSLTRDLARQMALARQQAILDRQRKQSQHPSVPSGYAPGSISRSSQLTSSPNSQMPARTTQLSNVQPQYAPQQPGGYYRQEQRQPYRMNHDGAIADSQINNVFRQIDKGYHRPSAYPEIQQPGHSTAWRNAVPAQQPLYNSQQMAAQHSGPMNSSRQSAMPSRQQQQPFGTIQRTQHETDQQGGAGSRLPIWPQKSNMTPAVVGHLPAQAQTHPNHNSSRNINHEALRLGHNAGTGGGMFPMPAAQNHGIHSTPNPLHGSNPSPHLYPSQQPGNRSQFPQYGRDRMTGSAGQFQGRRNNAPIPRYGANQSGLQPILPQ